MGTGTEQTAACKLGRAAPEEDESVSQRRFGLDCFCSSSKGCVFRVVCGGHTARALATAHATHASTKTISSNRSSFSRVPQASPLTIMRTVEREGDGGRESAHMMQ